MTTKFNLLPPAEIEYAAISDTVIDGVSYTHRGTTRFVKVTIEPEYAGDVGLQKHELRHVAQFEMWPVAAVLVAVALSFVIPPQFAALALVLGAGHPVAERLSRTYRIWVEASAYRTQMHYPDDKGDFLTAEKAAERLALPSYGFGLTKEEALKYFQ